MAKITQRDLAIILRSAYPASFWTVRTLVALAERHGAEQVDRWWQNGQVEVFRQGCVDLLTKNALTETLAQRELTRLNHFFQQQRWQSLATLQKYWHRQNQLLARRGIIITTFFDPNWPIRLNELVEPPSVLWSTRPLAPLLDRPCLAVVGTRSLTYYGRRAATYFGRVLGGDYGITIVSGCARGADWTTQAAALRAGGQSIGLLGCGITYPPARCQEVPADSRLALVSEFAPFSHSAKWYFPFRNRLIAGLAQSVLVIEAGEHSGSFITIQAAREQNKTVMILSQPFFNDNTHALQALAGEGSARVVVRPENVLEELGIKGKSGQPLPTLPKVLVLAQNEAEQQALTALYQRGGQAFASDLSAWKQACLSLEARGLISEQLGVYQLSGMIQS